MADDKNNKDKPLIDIDFTPEEEERLKREFRQEYGRALAKKREALSEKIMNAWNGNAKFKLCDTRIVDMYTIDGLGLTARISESESPRGSAYGLSVEVNYSDLYDLHDKLPFKSKEERSLSEEFNQKRATVIQIATYDSLDELQKKFKSLNDEFLFVLLEAGAEGSRLDIQNGAYILRENDIESPANKFSDALKIARQIQYIRLLDTDEDINYGQARLALIQPILLDTGLELNVERKYVFTNEATEYKAIDDDHRDLGRYQIMNTESDLSAIMTAYKSLHAQDSQVYHGTLTGNLLQQHFFNRVFDAAAEIGLVSEKIRERIVPHITHYKGINLAGGSEFKPAA